MKWQAENLGFYNFRIRNIQKRNDSRSSIGHEIGADGMKIFAGKYVYRLETVINIISRAAKFLRVNDHRKILLGIHHIGLFRCQPYPPNMPQTVCVILPQTPPHTLLTLNKVQIEQANSRLQLIDLTVDANGEHLFFVQNAEIAQQTDALNVGSIRRCDETTFKRIV